MYYKNDHSKNKTTAQFNIQTNQLRNWISKKPQLLKIQPGVKRLNMGAKPKYPALETALLTWVKEKRKNQNAVTQIGSFVFSNKWLDGFMRQKNLSNHHHITIAQYLPDDLVEKQQEFLSYIIYRHIQYDYPLAYIGNMDKMPVSFDLPSNTTIDELGARSVSICTTEHEKANFTVVLTCMADGTKLLSLIIFKLKNVPQGNFPPEIIIHANQKGWMRCFIGLKTFELNVKEFLIHSHY
ncbi:pogo transposable element with KRAB domain [Rhizophagus clarus]|uniref:Pogo transposable element with KRAB domain n=1 Tax=Rhizophagus clarus TaxID=94130 RepID=A0A8H3L034_9GLOM|nr:pogo transposable element with KRAB domain [Rhizophagus clarus]